MDANVVNVASSRKPMFSLDLPPSGNPKVFNRTALTHLVHCRCNKFYSESCCWLVVREPDEPKMAGCGSRCLVDGMSRVASGA